MEKINTSLLALRRKRYQNWLFKTESRRSRPDVWVFRWRDQASNGETIRRKVVLGTVKDLNKTQSQKKMEDQRQLLNEPSKKPSTAI